MPPFAVSLKPTQRIMPNGKTAHPLEDPLNWPEQQDFAKLHDRYRTISQWIKKRTPDRLKRVSYSISRHQNSEKTN